LIPSRRFLGFLGSLELGADVVVAQWFLSEVRVDVDVFDDVRWFLTILMNERVS